MSRLPILIAILALIIVAAAPSGSLAQDGNDDDSRWPLLLDAERADVVIYQPQVESFDGTTLEARAAVSVTRTGETAPVFGAVWFTARMATDMDTRMVTLVGLDVTAAKFPDISDQELADLSDYLAKELPEWDISISLDLLVASADDTKLTGGAGFKNDPPEIIFREAPAILILIDGDPKLSRLGDFDLQYVSNSAFFIAEQKGAYYLYGGGMWFLANAIEGPWKNTTDLPPDIQEVAKKIAEDEARQAEEDAKAAADAAAAAAAAGETAPPEDDADGARPDTRIPEIIVRTGAAELIFTDGAPNFVPVQNTQLLYMDNTESDVLMDIASQQYYILVSGRWYTSPRMADGKWAFVEPNALPAEFARIPEDSDIGNVLPSVAGTQQAKEAVLTNSVPQTAEIDRATATVEVTYDGDPQFEKCSDNGVAYAVNTDKSVLLIDKTYYCCDDAVWFVSSGPSGPWKVADKIPDAVQDIPPECPVYNVKYVYIYDSTPEVVYVGYTPAYTYSYVYGGVVVYGTGWYYSPWYGAYYYPRPVTYGFHVHYNPWTGWGFSVGVGGGWLRVGVGWGRPPYYGWWGPAGYRHGYHHGYGAGYRHGAAHGYAAGYRAGQRQGTNNMYRDRSNGVKATGRNEVTKSHQRQSQAGNTQAKREPKKAPNQKNNVYADKNGNAYRQQGNDMQKRDNKSNNWSKSDPNKNKQSQQNVQRDAQKRNRSNQQTKNYNKSRNSSRQRSGGGRRR